MLNSVAFERTLASAKPIVNRYRRPIAVVVYLGLAWAANVLAFLVRFDGQVPAKEWASQWAMLPWLLALRTCGFMAFGRFRGLWRYPSLYDLRDILLAVLSSSVGVLRPRPLDPGANHATRDRSTSSTRCCSSRCSAGSGWPGGRTTRCGARPAARRS